MENEKKPTPTCRYCGAEMEDDSYCWRCPECYSSSPIVIWDESCDTMTEADKRQYAYEAAMKYPPLKPMSLDEVKKHIGEEDPSPLWIEDCAYPENSGWDDNDSVKYWLEDDENTEKYGIEWRCWLSKPTEERMRRFEFEKKRVRRY